jgi:hypothetical protein
MRMIALSDAEPRSNMNVDRESWPAGRLVDQGQQSHRRILKHRDEHVDPAIPEADYSRVIARGRD